MRGLRAGCFLGRGMPQIAFQHIMFKWLRALYGLASCLGASGLPIETSKPSLFAFQSRKLERFQGLGSQTFPGGHRAVRVHPRKRHAGPLLSNCLLQAFIHVVSCRNSVELFPKIPKQSLYGPCTMTLYSTSPKTLLKYLRLTRCG